MVFISVKVTLGRGYLFLVFTCEIFLSEAAHEVFMSSRFAELHGGGVQRHPPCERGDGGAEGGGMWT